jgi:hypothetical protein
MINDLIKYFQIRDRKKKLSLVRNDDFLIKLDVENLDFKVLNHPQEFFKGIEIYQNPLGTYCLKDHPDLNYMIQEINKKEVDKILESRKKEWTFWKEYVSGSNNFCYDCSNI